MKNLDLELTIIRDHQHYNPLRVKQAVQEVREKHARTLLTGLSLTEDWWRTALGMETFAAAGYAYGDLTTEAEAARQIGVPMSRLYVATLPTHKRPAIVGAFFSTRTAIRVWNQDSYRANQIRAWLKAHPDAWTLSSSELGRRMQADWNEPAPPSRTWILKAVAEVIPQGGNWYVSMSEVRSAAAQISAIKPGR